MEQTRIPYVGFPKVLNAIRVAKNKTIDLHGTS